MAPIAAGPLAFVVGNGVPANTMREFIALARQKPGKLNYGSAGTGSINHLALELLNVRAGINIVHVPYRGIADATKDLLAGNIQAMTASIPATLPQVAEKRMKVLAVTGTKRIPQLPDVPSWQEEGVPERQRDQLLGHRRAGRHAAGDRREAQRGNAEGAGAAGRARAPGARRRGNHQRAAGAAGQHRSRRISRTGRS